MINEKEQLLSKPRPSLPFPDKRVCLEDILEITDELTGRFLGACRVQASKPVTLGIPTREPLFDGIIQGFRIQIVPSPLTRTMIVWINNCGKFSILLDKDWTLPGGYREQFGVISKELYRVHYGLFIDTFRRPEHFFYLLSTRDQQAMETFLPSGMEFKFKGHKGAFFWIDGIRYHLKQRSRHDIQLMKEEFVQLRDALIEHMVKIGYTPDDKPDYNGQIERYHQFCFEAAINYKHPSSVIV